MSQPSFSICPDLVVSFSLSRPLTVWSLSRLWWASNTLESKDIPARRGYWRHEQNHFSILLLQPRDEFLPWCPSIVATAESCMVFLWLTANTSASAALVTPAVKVPSTDQDVRKKLHHNQCRSNRHNLKRLCSLPAMGPCILLHFFGWRLWLWINRDGPKHFVHFLNDDPRKQ